MQFRARYFNSKPSDPELLVTSIEWGLSVADDASGREIVRTAMLAADWPLHPYKVQDFQKTNHHINFAVSIAEKPSELISLMLKDERGQYECASFLYRAPIKSQLPEKIANRFAMFGIFLICCFAWLLIVPRHIYCAIRYPQRAKAIAVAIDRAANAALYGNPSETISSRANRARIEGRRWGCILCKALDWFRHRHCEDAAGK